MKFGRRFMHIFIIKLVQRHANVRPLEIMSLPKNILISFLRDYLKYDFVITLTESCTKDIIIKKSGRLDSCAQSTPTEVLKKKKKH